MTGVVLDAAVLIDHLRGLPEAVEFLSQLPAPPHCSEVTRVEVGRGLRSGERSAAKRLFAAMQWVPLTTNIAEAALELGRVWRRSHHTIDLADLVVAATAQCLGLPVATTNVKRFPMFEGLARPYG
ncbi:MAG: type II toxin-antitoxin system VapC family toxin [Egibacteraceae bacterium]